MAGYTFVTYPNKPGSPKISFTNEISSYILVKKSANFKQAIKNSKKYGGYLAEMNSPGESLRVFDAVTGLITGSQRNKTRAPDGGGAAYLWLGGSDAGSEGAWTWQSSKAVIGLNQAEWGKGALGREPDNFGGKQHYLGLGLDNWPLGSTTNQGFGNAGSWNDLSGTNKLFYLVELSQ